MTCGDFLPCRLLVACLAFIAVTAFRIRACDLAASALALSGPGCTRLVLAFGECPYAIRLSGYCTFFIWRLLCISVRYCGPRSFLENRLSLTW